MVPVKRYRHEPVRSRIGRPGHPVVGLVTRWSTRSPVGRPGHPSVGLVTRWSTWSPVSQPGYPLGALAPWTRLLLTTQHRRPKYKARIE